MACSLTFLFTCLWSWMLYSAAGYGAPVAPENTVYFSFLSRWLSQGAGVGQPKSPSLSCCSGDDLSRARCDGNLSAMYGAEKRARELLIRSQSSTHFLSSRFTHTHVGHTCVHKKRVHVRGTHITFMAFLPQWAFTLSSGNAIPTSLEGRGSFHRSSHFLPASAEEEVDTLVLCSDKPERGSHPAARTRCEIRLVTDWTGFLFNPLQMMRSTDICQVPFPHVSPASTSSLSVIIWI